MCHVFSILAIALPLFQIVDIAQRIAEKKLPPRMAVQSGNRTKRRLVLKLNVCIYLL